MRLIDRPEYWVWVSMKRRCFNPKATGFQHYGGRGITVCRRWARPGGHLAFIADMGPRPTDGVWWLERINNDGNYEPKNCRWATPSEQRRNTRSKTMTFEQAARHEENELRWRRERALRREARRARRSA